MTQLKALIFDVDGTLAETERDGHRIAFNQTFKNAGLDWNWSESLYGELLEITGGKERIRFYLEKYCPEFIYPPNFSQFVADLHQTKTKFYQELLSTGSISLRPGVRRLLERAKMEKIRLAIATTSALPNVMSLLEHSLDPEGFSWFEVIGAGDIVPLKKPAPDIYQYVLNQLKLTPEECLVIEDSYPGLIAAKQAGLKTIITVNEYTQYQDFSQGILVLNHLGEPDFPCQVLQGELEGNYVQIKDLRNLV